jgi:type IV pilus assembly protein PilC
MAMYQYQIRESTGALSKGQIAADTLAEAAGLLRAQGAFVVDVAPVEGVIGILGKLRSIKIDFGPGLKDVLNFTSQLSVMIKAGISVRAAVSGIADQIDNPRFKRMVTQIRRDVEEGKPFSEALSRYPKVFSPLYVNMVRASEMSGSFGHMLERIAGYLRQQVETRAMVRGAMVYPIILAVMAVTVTIFLLTFVLPRFSALFAGREALLPLPTKMLLGLSAFVRHYWYALVGCALAGTCGFYYVIHTPVGRAWWDLVKLKLPLLKKMFRALYLTRGLQTMGEMVNAGVPMLETLEITADVSGNTLYRNMWMAVFRSVKGGKKIAAPLARIGLLPKNVVQMISAGEESGKLSEVLTDVADFYAQELRYTIKAATAMIEPVMIVLMGFVVGFIAMSIILPIFKLSQLVK